MPGPYTFYVVPSVTIPLYKQFMQKFARVFSTLFVSFAKSIFGMKHKLQAVRENKSLEFVPSAITNLRLVSPGNIYAGK